MPFIYDASLLRIDGFRQAAELCHYLKSAYPRPRLEFRLIPFTQPYFEQEIYDLESGRFLGQWLDGCFDFAGADDEVVEKLDALFRANFHVTE